MTFKSVTDKAEAVCAKFAGTTTHDQVLTVRLFCNSDSAFLAWAKKTGGDLLVIRKARSLQQAWAALKIARTKLITIRAVLATVAKLFHAGKITKKLALEIINALQQTKPKAVKNTAETAGDGQLSLAFF